MVPIARFIGVASVATLCSIILSACQDDVAVDDEEFLSSVREQAASAPAPASDIDPTLDPNVKAYPNIELETDDVQMGTVPHDRVTEKRMKIYNRGKGPLKIKKVSTNCSCTRGRVERSEIPPGESTDLIISIHPSLIYSFDATRMLTIESNDPSEPLAPLTVTSHLEPEFEILPFTRDLGAIQVGQGVSRSYRIVQLIEDALDIFSVSTTSEYVTATVSEAPRENWRSEDRREFDLTLTLEPDAPAGKINFRVNFETNLRRTRQVYVSFATEVHESPFSAIPSRAILRGVEPGDTIEDLFTLESIDPIDSVEVADETGNGTLSINRDSGENQATLDLTVGSEIDELAEPFRATVRVIIDGEAYPQRFRAHFERDADTEQG